MSVEIKRTDKFLALHAPYNPAANRRLKALGGRWDVDAKRWKLPLDVEAQLRSLCLEVYGIDPLSPAPEPLFSVQIDLTGWGAIAGDSLIELGRPLLRRPFRDSAVKPEPGVSILSGGFPSHNGSRLSPVIGYPEAETMLLVREVSQHSIDAFREAHPGIPIQIVEGSDKLETPLSLATTLAVRLAELLPRLSPDDQQKILDLLLAG